MPTGIVIGGSISGLLSAQALATTGWDVIILERETLPAEPAPRKGTPQCHHAHVLLKKGLTVIEDLAPGFTEQLLAFGAVEVNATRDWHTLFQSGLLARGESDLDFITSSRLLIEFALRKIVSSHPRISIRENCRVLELRFGEAGMPRIRTNDGWLSLSRDASLLIDASGRHSKTPKWLQASGFEAPTVSKTAPNLGYASCRFRNLKLPQGVRGMISMYRAPEHPRAGIIIPIENASYLVTLSGLNGHYPPTEESGFMEFAATLRAPEFCSALETGTRASDIKGFRKQTNELRHFDRTSRKPESFIVTGDAVCSFNPIYGQGITAAALAASRLRRCINAGRFDSGSLQKAVLDAYRDPWATASAEDLRWIENPPLRITVMHWLMDSMNMAASHDLETAKMYLSVLHMVDRPSAFLRPRFIIKALTSSLKGQ